MATDIYDDRLEYLRREGSDEDPPVEINAGSLAMFHEWLKRYGTAGQARAFVTMNDDGFLRASWHETLDAPDPNAIPGSPGEYIGGSVALVFREDDIQYNMMPPHYFRDVGRGRNISFGHGGVDEVYRRIAEYGMAYVMQGGIRT